MLKKLKLQAPLAVLAELSHRCPLSCAYCSNPIELIQKNKELETKDWLKVIDEAADMGIYQIHFSGGEPTARKDLEDMVEHAHKRKMYTNLITSAVLLTRERLEKLKSDVPVSSLESMKQTAIDSKVAENSVRIDFYL